MLDPLGDERTLTISSKAVNFSFVAPKQGPGSHEPLQNSVALLYFFFDKCGFSMREHLKGSATDFPTIALSALAAVLRGRGLRF